jgi:2,5-furandicarboxylate decarboxylase 1
VVTPHTWIIYKKYEERGEPMPFALFLGHHPCYELAANYSGLHLDQFGEIDLVGTFLDETVEMVKCETIDLEVPAHAEIVIEGYIPPKIREDEGPSPSPCLYYVPGVAKMPVFKVTAITMREDAIYRHMQSTTFTDHQVLPRLCHEAILYNRLREMGVKVHDVFFPPWGGALSVIIQMTNEFDGQVNDALMLAMGAPWLNTKFVIAVDEDINIYDPAEIYYALATRVDPSSDVIIVPRTRANPMDPSGTPIPHIASGSVRRVVGKWGIDATKPPAYKAERRAEFDRAWPKEWGKVFLKDFI